MTTRVPQNPAEIFHDRRSPQDRRNPHSRISSAFLECRRNGERRNPRAQQQPTPWWLQAIYAEDSETPPNTALPAE